MVREQLPKKGWTTTETGALCLPPPLRGQWGLLAPHGMKGMESRGLQSLAECLAVHPGILPGSLGTSPLRGHFSLCAPAEEERAALELSPSRLLGPHTLPATNLFTQDWELRRSLGAGATSHPPGLLNFRGQFLKGFSLRTTVGDPSCPRGHGWAFSSCSPPAIAQSVTRWQQVSDARLRLGASGLE